MLLHKAMSINPIITGNSGVQQWNISQYKPDAASVESLPYNPPTFIGIEAGINQTIDTLNWAKSTDNWGEGSDIGRATLNPNPGSQYSGIQPFNGKAPNNPNLPPWYDIAGIIAE